MLEINDQNGASIHTAEITRALADSTLQYLYGCEMGVAYGGGIERIGRAWKGRGTVWGFDTFEGHPKQLADICPDTIAAGGVVSHAAYCMDPHYKQFGRAEYTEEYIRAELDKQGLDNVVLVKGLVTPETDISFIPHLDYCFLDMDFPISMYWGYELVKSKIVKGGYLCLHDVIPAGHIAGLKEFYQKVLDEGLFELIGEHPISYLAILRKK